MITPEYSKLYNCRVCGWRHCPGCEELPELDDGFDYDPHTPEAFGWRPATAEDVFSVPKKSSPPPGNATL